LFAQLVLGVLGVLAFSGEYSTGMICECGCSDFAIRFRRGREHAACRDGGQPPCAEPHACHRSTSEWLMTLAKVDVDS
jgi:hypothetical protein